MPFTVTSTVPSHDAQRSEHAALPAALFRAWVTRAKPGERLEYRRGLLALDRVKATSSLKQAERRKLATVADHALALAHQGKLHLLQERMARATTRTGQSPELRCGAGRRDPRGG